MKPITIGHDEAGAVHVDVAKLVTTRALVQANSGGGKSYCLRKLVECIGLQMPVVMLDPEGEFWTLRELLDIVLVRTGGDLVPRIESAGALATQLLEARTSAVIDLSDFKPSERRSYVRKFCETLIAAPKRLWNPTTIVLDEAHEFAPEKGAAESLDAVVSLATLGRKRSFCPVFATQRLSKLHKDAAAELNNVLIGRATLDIDQKRAAITLGISGDEARALRDLPEGCFKCYGPAFDRRGVFQMKVDTVKTSHGQEQLRKASVPAPSERLRAKLPELEALGKPDPNRIDDLDQAKRRIGDLAKQVQQLTKAAAQPSAASPKTKLIVDVQVVERAVARARAEMAKAARPLVQAINRSSAQAKVAIQTFNTHMSARDGHIDALIKLLEAPADTSGSEPGSPGRGVMPVPASLERKTGTSSGAAAPVHMVRAQHGAPTRGPEGGGGSSPPPEGVSARAMKFLDIAATLMSMETQVTRETVCGWMGLHPRGGSVGEMISELAAAGLVTSDRGTITVTDAGHAAARAVDADQAIEQAKGSLKPRQRKIFDLVDAAYPDSTTREEVAAAMNIHPRGGSLGEDIAALVGRGLITSQRGTLRTRDFLHAGGAQ